MSVNIIIRSMIGRGLLSCATACLNTQDYSLLNHICNAELKIESLNDSCIFKVCLLTYCLLGAESLKTNPNRCSLPFQYASQEFYSCMKTNSTPQCIAYSWQLVDCISPPGKF